MTLILFYIAIFLTALLVFSWSIFNYWNPDVSKLFKSERIKKFLYDRYWFINNKKVFKNKNLFLVFSNNFSEYFKELSEELDRPEILNFFVDQKNAFEIININNTSFVFFNHCLLQNNEDLQSMRLGLHLRNLIKIRKSLSIDGIIFFPNQNAFSRTTTNYKELSEEATNFAKIFKSITKKLKAKVPLFFIDNSRMNEVPPLHLFPLADAQNEHSSIFSFHHKTLSNGDDLYREMKIALDLCVESYENQTQHYLLTLDQNFQLKVIQFFFNLKSNIISFNKNYNDYFYKNINGSEKELTNSHYIINLNSFYKKDSFDETSSQLLNFFKYTSINLINGSLLSKEYIKEKLRNRTILATLTIINLLFVGYSLFSSTSFLTEKRSIFLKSFEELNKFIATGYNKIINENEHTNLLQSKICSLINNSNTLSKTNFHYPLLYPSWNSDIAQQYTDKYNFNLAKFISKVMVQSFNDKVASQLNSFKSIQPSSFQNHDEYLKAINTFVRDNKKISDIYAYLNGNTKNNTEALTLMANYLYGLDCGKSIAEKNVFSALNSTNLSQFVKPTVTDFNARSVEALKSNLAAYFIYSEQNHPLYKALDKVDSDIIFIKSGSHTSNKSDELQFLHNFINDLNSLQDNLLKSQNELKDVNSFYGPNFVTLLADLEKHSLFGKAFSSQVLEDAKRNFEKFKTDLVLFIPLGANFPIISSNGGLFILNSGLDQLAMALAKMENTFNQDNAFAQSSNKDINSDLKLVSLNLPINSLWDIEALQNHLQKGTIFASAMSSVNQSSLPESLALYFQNISKTLSYQYWNTKLANSIKVFSAANDQQPSVYSSQIDPNIQNIQISGPILKSISELLVSSNNSDLNIYLGSILNQQIVRQAKIYSRLLELSPFFNPNPSDFMNWSGDSSPAYLGFGVGSDDDLKMYLSTQKSNLEQFFNRSIAPLLQTRSLFFKDTSAVYDKSLENLISLQDALSPTPKINSYANFSNFISTNMNNLRTETCSKFIAQPPVIGARDYFSLKQREIYTALSKRCQSLLIKQAYQSYDKIALKFNNLLAGKFPFTTDSKSLDSASMDDMANFFQSFSEFQKQDLPTLINFSNLYKGRSDVQSFVQSIANAQSFFNIQTDKDGNISPTKWNIDFDFRTNSDREILGNQIINWSLQSGNQLIGSDQGNIFKGKFIWNYSDPLQFYVTLANTSKYSLDKFSQDKNIFITNNTIYYNIRNRWSLLKFINDYADCANINYCIKNTLKFEFPINNDKKVLFFVTINIKNNKGLRLNIPKLPTEAPYLDRKYTKSQEVD